MLGKLVGGDGYIGCHAMLATLRMMSILALCLCSLRSLAGYADNVSWLAKLITLAGYLFVHFWLPGWLYKISWLVGNAC
jgi:hypothetical protein